jgi:O-antigen ligase
MKWIVLAVFIILVPVLASWMRSRPSSVPFFWGLLGFLPLIVDGLKLDIAPISWGAWQGYSKGILVSLVDVLALAIVISRPRIKGLPPFLFLWLFFAFTTFLSAFQSEIPEAAMFAVWQVFRVTLIFLAVASICNDDRGPRTLLTGMSLGLAINAGFSIYERLTGTLQADGLYTHQNLLGLVSHFVAFPALAMLLGGVRSKILMLGVASAMTVAVLGASRGTIGLAGAGYGALLLLSLMRNATPRKWSIVAAGAVGLAIAAPLAISSLDRRFENTQQELSDYDERAAFEKAAKAMIADRPFGQGANQYVVIANTKGYSERGGVGYAGGSRSALVHNSYLLVGAEQGYLGLLAFIPLLGWPMFSALRLAFKDRKSGRGDLVLGCGITLAVIMLHIRFEWVFMSYEVQMMFAICLGTIAGVMRRPGEGGAVDKRRPPAAPQQTMAA